MTAVILGFMLSSTVCRAATFSWPSPPAWAATGPTSGNTETVDYGYNAQGSLRVSVFNNGATLIAPYPSTSSTVNVDGGTNTRSLQLADSTTATQASYQQVTVNFMYTNGASGVSFTLWDVDASGATPGFIDLISNVSATTTTGTTVYATASGNNTTYNTIANNGAAGLTITGASAAANTGANGNQGNVTLSFTGQITSLTFRWSNDIAGVSTNRTTQYIGVSPINFISSGAAFPEVNSSLAALMVCGGVMGLARFRRGRNAEVPQCQAHA